MIIYNHIQVVVVMPLDLAVYNVLTHLANVPAMLGTRVQHVTLLVDVIQQGQVVQHVMRQLVSVLVIQVIQEPHVIPVPPITTEKVMELVQVCTYLFHEF